jgi:hypothetical protein
MVQVLPPHAAETRTRSYRHQQDNLDFIASALSGFPINHFSILANAPAVVSEFQP